MGKTLKIQQQRMNLKAKLADLMLNGLAKKTATRLNDEIMFTTDGKTFKRLENEMNKLTSSGAKSMKQVREIRKKELKAQDDAHNSEINKITVHEFSVKNKQIKEKLGFLEEEAGVPRKVLKNIDEYTMKLKNINIADVQIKFATTEIMTKYESVMKKYVNQPVELKLVKVLLYDGLDQEGSRMYSFVVKNENITPENVAQKLHDFQNKQGDSMTYTLFLYSLTVAVYVKPDSGGCDTKQHTKFFMLNKHDKLKICSMKSTRNNCGFMCFIKALGKNGNVVKPDVIRAELNIELDIELNYEHMKQIAHYFEVGMIIFNVNKKIVSVHDVQNKQVVKILHTGNHYELVVDEINFKKCERCGNVLRTDNTEHKCNITNVSFKKFKDKKNDTIHIQKVACKTQTSIDDMIFYDLETFPDHRGLHQIYACGWWINGEYKQTYGQNCFDAFMNDIMSVEKKIICAYNGSSFDHYFTLTELTKRNANIDANSMIFNNNKLMALKFGEDKKENSLWDICLFLNCSLKRACEAYKISNQKLEFDHSKMKTWDDVETYRHEVEPYLKVDVMALKELYEKFSNFFYESQKINITKYVTISHMSYKIWASMLEHEVEIPKDEKKYKFIRKGTFGARCYPLKKYFTSKHYDAVIGKQMTYDEILKTKDFIFNADASSLYPASMKGFDLCPTAFPVGMGYWSNEAKECFESGKIGFYNITFKCPRDIMVPVLPRKIGASLDWSLNDGEGAYTSVDIENAIKVGYEVEFVGECLVWDQKENLFENYVTKYYEMKAQADKEKNDVKREVAKLMLNSIYGKMLQQRIETTNKIVDNISDFISFCNQYEIVDYKVLNDNKLLITGEITESNMEDAIRKPNFLGAFVLAYSRRIMLNYMLAIDPTLKTAMFTYTDTDSLHISGDAYFKLKEMGYIVSKDQAKLGYLCSDIKNEGVIIKEINLGPKMYMYEYINNKNEVKCDDTATMKCKGIPAHTLNHNLYKNEKTEEVKFHSLKKISINLTKKQKEDEINNFSIMSVEMKRRFLSTDWCKMKNVDNVFYPNGHVLGYN